MKKRTDIKRTKFTVEEKRYIAKFFKKGYIEKKDGFGTGRPISTNAFEIGIELNRSTDAVREQYYKMRREGKLEEYTQKYDEWYNNWKE